MSRTRGWGVEVYMSNPKRETSFFTTMKMAFTAPAQGPIRPGSRSQLDSGLRQTTATQPFTKAVAHMNQQLAMSNDTNLTRSQANHYTSLAKGVESGEVSNSYAHASAAFGWAKRGQVTGTLLNASAFLLAGAHDANRRKLGKF